MQNLFLLLAGILVGWIIQYLLLRRRIDRTCRPPAQLERIRDEVDRMIVQLNQTTDRNVSLLEDRIRQLGELLAKTDKKIGLLRREGEKHEVSQSVYNHLVRGRPPAPVEEAPGRRTERERGSAEAGGAGDVLGARSGQAEPAGRRDASPAPAPAVAGGSARGGDGRGAGRGDLRDEILRLHRAGFTPAMIARQINMNLGEVELVISLAEGAPW